MKPVHDAPDPRGRAEAVSPAEAPEAADLEHHPEVVLSVLEPDQLVSAKERARVGRRPLSRRVRLLLGGLRLYVIVMMILVAIQVVRAIQGGH